MKQAAEISASVVETWSRDAQTGGQLLGPPDDAYDHPDRWRGVTADVLFQRLAEFVEAAEEGGQPIDWRRDVTEPMIAWRSSDGEQ